MEPVFKPSLETLKSINSEFLRERWSDEDLRQLVTPTFGVVSSFESMLADLHGIITKDLGNVAPEAVSESNHDQTNVH